MHKSKGAAWQGNFFLFPQKPKIGEKYEQAIIQALMCAPCAAILKPNVLDKKKQLVSAHFQANNKKAIKRCELISTVEPKGSHQNHPQSALMRLLGHARRARASSFSQGTSCAGCGQGGICDRNQ